MKYVFAHNQAFDYYHIISQFKKLNQKFLITGRFDCTYQLAKELGLPLKLDYLVNALNIGQRKRNIHCAEEDAELTLEAAIKMLWLK